MSMSRKRPAERESEPPLASSRKRERECEPPLDWRKSLTVDSLVEALDVQNLWYPARVIQMEGSKVLLHFLGWGDEWDEWIERDSSRLRRHRGWGTPAMPTDWQQDSIIEALDMEGKWYAADVLYVASHSVMVHYHGWSAKWNEWLGKDSGRLRVRHSAKQDPAPAASRQSDGHDDVCALCEEVGELICCEGRCKRVFHRDCVPSNNPILSNGRRWLCADCRCQRMRCFFCKQWGATHELRSCARRTCGKFYHPECLAASLQPFASPEVPLVTPPASSTAAVDGDGEEGGNEEGEEEGGGKTVGGGGAGGKVKAKGGGKGKVAALCCARHYCAHCLGPESAGYGKAMMRCVRCVTSYHRACLPTTPLTMITPTTFLCHRCYNNAPRGLNAPDPTLPPTVHSGGGDAELAGDRGDDNLDRGDDNLALDLRPEIEIVGEGPSLSAFAHATLPDLQEPIEFEQPADLLRALHARQLLPCHGFAPTPYKTIKQSVVLHKNAREALPATDSLACMCTLTNGGCDENCQNRLMQQECLPSLCLCGDLCANRPFARHHADPLPLQLFKTAYKGWGVKLEQSCTKGELVVEYVGEVIDSASWEERKQQLSRFDHMYFMALNQNEIVDATRKGNIARFINHSCAPNLVVQKWFINRLPRLGLFATQDIPAGAEITYNYSVKWSGDPDLAQRCYCGAPNCTGYLGAPPRRE